eukprot:1143330-Pelagomonas_calceolata.AAC.1
MSTKPAGHYPPKMSNYTTDTPHLPLITTQRIDTTPLMVTIRNDLQSGRSADQPVAGLSQLEINP